MKNIFKNITILFAMCLSQSAYSALEVISIEFSENSWTNNDSSTPTGRIWPFTSFSGQNQWDLKKLINDNDVATSKLRSYVLNYDESNDNKRRQYDHKLDLDGAIVASVEVRARGTADTKFSVNLGSQVSSQLGFRRANDIFNNVIFSSLQMTPLPKTPANGNWTLTMHGGKADINQIVIHLYTNGKSCLRVLCGQYAIWKWKNIEPQQFLDFETTQGFAFKSLRLIPNVYTFQFVNIPTNAAKINMYLVHHDGAISPVDKVVAMQEFTNFPSRKNYIVKDNQNEILGMHIGKRLISEVVDNTGKVLAEYTYKIDR